MSEELLICPLDKFHAIRPMRFVQHINQCKKNFPDVQLATCPNNGAHILRKNQMPAHLKTCPSRVKEEWGEYKTSMGISGNPTTKFVLGQPDDGDWGSASPVEPRIHPTIKALESTISRNVPNGFSKTQRRAFRMAEAERMERIVNNQSISDIEFPTENGIETVDAIINRCKAEMKKTAPSSPDTDYLDQNAVNIMATGEQLQSKYVPRSLIPGGEPCRVGGVTTATSADKSETRPAWSIPNNPLPVLAPRANVERGRGYGRGSRIQEKKDPSVGGLQQMTRK